MEYIFANKDAFYLLISQSAGSAYESFVDQLIEEEEKQTALFLAISRKERPTMTKPREKIREELQAEIENGKKKIRQFENREKMLRQKLSKEERRTRSHRLIVRGAVFESIVPEAKNMTDEEAAALLRLALTSELVREFLRKRAEETTS